VVWQPHGFCIDARRHDRGARESAQHWKPELDSADPIGTSGDLSGAGHRLHPPVRRVVNQ
jgi:hypothetical protein